ncbi:MAG: Holliday junction resolvase RuvX [Corynebacteriales bacterium]|nr:Holliday junction resolvase RuvX [Mycobacteriales bacterium]
MSGEWTRGVRLGIDVGEVRIGVALSDPDGILASPLTTVKRQRSGADLDELVRIVRDHQVVEVIVGMPKSLSGTKGRAALAAEKYAGRLAARIAPVPLSFADERLTTVVATRVLREAGVRGKRQRAVVDQVAAVEILQSWLQERRNLA